MLYLYIILYYIVIVYYSNSIYYSTLYYTRFVILDYTKLYYICYCYYTSKNILLKMIDSLINLVSHNCNFIQHKN